MHACSGISVGCRRHPAPVCCPRAVERSGPGLGSAGGGHGAGDGLSLQSCWTAGSSAPLVGLVGQLPAWESAGSGWATQERPVMPGALLGLLLSAELLPWRWAWLPGQVLTEANMWGSQGQGSWFGGVSRPEFSRDCNQEPHSPSPPRNEGMQGQHGTTEGPPPN